MYKYHHIAAHNRDDDDDVIVPPVYMNLFDRNKDIHSYNTRMYNSLHVPLARCDLTSRNVRVTGVKFYNYFLQRLDWNVLYTTFKYNLKKHILENDITFLLS